MNIDTRATCSQQVRELCDTPGAVHSELYTNMCAHVYIYFTNMYVHLCIHTHTHVYSMYTKWIQRVYITLYTCTKHTPCCMRIKHTQYKTHTHEYNMYTKIPEQLARNKMKRRAVNRRAVHSE